MAVLYQERALLGGRNSRYCDWLRDGRSGFETIFPYSSRLAPRPAHAASRTGYRVSFPGGKWPRRGIDHPLCPVPKLKEEQSCSFTPPLGLHYLWYGALDLSYHFACHDLNAVLGEATKLSVKSTLRDLCFLFAASLKLCEILFILIFLFT